MLYTCPAISYLQGKYPYMDEGEYLTPVTTDRSSSDTDEALILSIYDSRSNSFRMSSRDINKNSLEEDIPTFDLVSKGHGQGHVKLCVGCLNLMKKGAKFGGCNSPRCPGNSGPKIRQGSHFHRQNEEDMGERDDSIYDDVVSDEYPIAV